MPCLQIANVVWRTRDNQLQKENSNFGKTICIWVVLRLAWSLKKIVFAVYERMCGAHLTLKFYCFLARVAAHIKHCTMHILYFLPPIRKNMNGLPYTGIRACVGANHIKVSHLTYDRVWMCGLLSFLILFSWRMCALNPVSDVWEQYNARAIVKYFKSVF